MIQEEKDSMSGASKPASLASRLEALKAFTRLSVATSIHRLRRLIIHFLAGVTIPHFFIHEPLLSRVALPRRHARAH